MANGFLNIGMLIFMAAALVIALRRAERADRENPDRKPPTFSWSAVDERWAAIRQRSAHAAEWLMHPRAHHRH
jgi:hypothetical protein